MKSILKTTILEVLKGYENKAFHFDYILAPFGVQTLAQEDDDVPVGIIAEALSEDPREELDVIDVIDIATDLGCELKGLMFPIFDPEFAKI
jgi:hypothetical protein